MFKGIKVNKFEMHVIAHKSWPGEYKMTVIFEFSFFLYSIYITKDDS